MRARNSSRSYGAIAMALHWAVFVFVLGAWMSGQFGAELPRGARETGLFVHISLGLAILGFVMARLAWRAADPVPAPVDSPLGLWGERAGQAVHYMLYALLIAVPIAGIVVQFAKGHALRIFGLFEIVSPWTADRAFGRDTREVHDLLANGTMTLIGLHAAAALVHHYIFRDRALLRMLPCSRS
ncbi:cytochrome b [Bradyrhizobium diazoefficiens]|nr:cytochrome b [Bradyrhizobium diazoefficiens]QQO36253.1 cytochrome b [Bradyrhizobium diazoefficiens]